MKLKIVITEYCITNPLRISLRRYNYKFGLLLDFSAALCGVPCSMEYSFREND